MNPECSGLAALHLESCQEHEDEQLFQLLAKKKILSNSGINSLCVFKPNTGRTFSIQDLFSSA